MILLSRPAFVAGFVAIVFCSCKTASFSKYFPLSADKAVVFERVVDSTKEVRMDTIYCREVKDKLMRSDKNSVMTAGKHQITRNQMKDINVYYFDWGTKDSGYRKYSDHYSFFHQSYSYNKKRFYFTYDWSKEMEYGVSFVWLLPAQLKVNTYYQFWNGDYSRSFIMVGRKPVQVDGVNYKDCIQMDVIESFLNTKRIARLWLAKNTGLVKWEVRNDIVPFVYKLDPEKYMGLRIGTTDPKAVKRR